MRWRRTAGKEVVDTSTAQTVGHLDALVIDPATTRVTALVVGDRVLSWDDTGGIGRDAVTIDGRDRLRAPDGELEREAVAGRTDPVGKPTYADDGIAMGTVGDVDLDPATGDLRCLLLADDQIEGRRLLGIGSFAVVVASSARASVDGDLASLTKSELYDLARERDLAGRSSMTKAELVDALR